MRRGHAPAAAGAAPATEVVAVDPNQAFIHTASPNLFSSGFEFGRDGRNTWLQSSAEGGLLPSQSIFHGFEMRESNRRASSCFAEEHLFLGCMIFTWPEGGCYECIQDTG